MSHCVMLLPWATNTVSPSGWSLMLSMGAVSFTVDKHLPVCKLHSLRVPSSDPERAFVPSGVICKHRIMLVCSVKVRRQWPVVKSHSLRIPSADPERAFVPSGVICKQRISLVCSVKVRRQWPVVKSHSLRVPSSDPERAFVPSGVICKQWIRLRPCVVDMRISLLLQVCSRSNCS